MKKLIIISLAFFALALVSCGKSEEKKRKDCEEQGKEYVDGECKEKATPQDQASCEKDGTMKWDASKPEADRCVAKTQAECTGDKVEWKENKCVAKEGAEEATYSISNQIVGRTVTVTSGTATKTLAANASATTAGGCVLVKASQIAQLKVVLDATTGDNAQVAEVLCDNTATPKQTCHPFNGLVTTTNNQNELRQSNLNPKITENCAEVLSAPAAAS